ncbi:MAG: Tetratricopeptide repeat protein [archaeon GW2011_AR13]|nr:MAG: Tetratricopeptide repeat protein [archaeon GW2011_AR13]HIG94737.1 tetratricopeptide repeat protein [Nanoarchaeota archaeon]HIH63703.1 tetratricopeptide repeat protein [Nanoarchaeota archaeon]HIJ09576.1 tetratricopeptide repeat protein [Nanoarchaeota archaeon]
MNKKEIFSQIEKIYNSRKNKPTLQELDTIIKLCNLGLKETIDEEIIFERGFAFKKKGNLESALRDLKNVINLDPNASINHEMGEIYHQQKEYEKALEFYKKELEYNPESSVTYFQIGEIYAAQKNFEKSLKYLEMAILLAPNQIEPYISRSSILYYEFNKKEESLNDINAILRIDPTNLTYQISKACLLLELGKQKEGALETKKIIQENPEQIIEIFFGQFNKQ